MVIFIISGLFLFSQLLASTGEELCHPSPCGSNTNCEVANGVPTCTCKPGYYGSPISGCRRDCENDSECGPILSCIESKCQNRCTQCGTNTECKFIRNHQAVCKCLKGYFGNPYESCQPECTSNTHCPRSKPVCFSNSCKNPCDGICGVGANCKLQKLRPVCSCPSDMTGDPFVRCRLFESKELCEPNPCGSNARCEPGFDRYNKQRPVCNCHTGYTGDPLKECVKEKLCHHFCGSNTNCEVANGVPTCICKPGYHGSPISGCRHDCENDSECGPALSCIEFKCQNPCTQCGTNAECETIQNHQAVCKCPKGYFGDPFSSCQPGCASNSDCPRSKPACFSNSCKNPCDGVCGVGAICKLRGLTPICSCSGGGDPFVECTLYLSKEYDLCEPNPCGSNAQCKPGFDRNNKERPVCSCRTGYTGDPLRECARA